MHPHPGHGLQKLQHRASLLVTGAVDDLVEAVPVHVSSIDERVAELIPGGLAFDAEATVASVPRREAAPQALASQLTGQEIEPAVVVNQSRLDRAVRAMDVRFIVRFP